MQRKDSAEVEVIACVERVSAEKLRQVQSMLRRVNFIAWLLNGSEKTPQHFASRVADFDYFIQSKKP